MSPTRLDQLECCQNRALRVITDQLKTNPLRAIRMEAEVASIAKAVQYQAAMVYEEAHHLIPNHQYRTSFDALRHHKLVLCGQGPNEQVFGCYQLFQCP